MNPARVRTIINRYSSTAGVSDEDLARFLGASPDFCVPNDYATAITSVNEGRPTSDVGPGSSIDDAFRELARHSFEWLGLPAPEAQKKKGGWKLGLFGKTRRDS